MRKRFLAATVALVAFGALACAQSTRVDDRVRGGDAPPVKPSGLAVLRPRIGFSDEREFVGGAAFLIRPEGRAPVAITAAHLVSSNLGDDSLRSIELLDAKTREPLARATGYAYAGFRPSGLELAHNVAVLTIGDTPQSVTPLVLSERLPEIGEEVTIYAASSGGDSAQAELPGRIVERDRGRIAVELAPGANTRALAGAPVLANRSGEVVGIAQSSASRGDRPIVLASPVTPLLELLERLPETPIPLSEWKLPARGKAVGPTPDGPTPPGH